MSIPLTCSDPDGDALTLATVDPPAEGTLGPVSGGAVTYTPDANAAGVDSFTYRASDGVALSAPATVTISISHAPACDDVSLRTAVDTAVTIPLSCSDADGDALTLAIGDGPSKGSLGAISGGEVTYTPDAGAFGADSFTYSADDGQGDGAPATVSITISRPPSCDDASVRTAADTAVQVPLACTDPDGDTLTLSAVTQPSKGSLGAIAGGMVVYTPASGEYGADSFTYRATDGTADSAPATAHVTISRPPTCDDASLTARAGSAVTIPLTCTDPDGDDLTLAKATGPAQGTLSAFGPSSVTYTPDLDADGQDSFTYTASDGVATSQPATVTIAITHPPRCDAVARRTRAATSVSVPLSCSDADGDPLTLSIAGGPSKGTLGAISGNAVTYTPNAGASGQDSFTYVAGDGTSDSAPATATITISRAPVCRDLLHEKTAVGQALSITLDCLDQDDDPLTLSVVDAPAQGTLGAIAGGKVTYTPADGYFGPDSFTYRADDGDGGTLETATVSLTVTRPPACDPVSAETPAGEPVEVTLTCADPDGDDVTLETASGPAHGTLGAISGGKVTYTPAAHYSGPDSFTYRASDGTATSAPATVSITVIPPPNTAPTCDPVARTAPAGEATEIQLSCSDGEDDPLTLSIVDAPDHGTLGAIAGGKVTYTPDDGYHGEDSFTYGASDSDLESSPATVTLTVIAPPTVSLAVDHSSAAKGTTLHFVASADDPDGGSIDEYRFSVDGAVVQTGASATLSPRFDAPGSHTVAVRAKDDEGQTASATKSVTISAPSGGGSTTPPAGGSPPAPPAGGRSGGPPPAPTLAVAKQKLKAVLAKGLAVRVTCSCTLKLQLVVDKKTAKTLKLGKRATVVGTVTRTVGGSLKLKIKLTAKARKALKKARSVKLTVRAGAVTKRVTVKR